MNIPPSIPHDRFFRGAFSLPAVAAGFFRAYLPAELLQSLRMDSLSLCKDTFIEKELRDFRSDLLYQAGWHGERQVWLYLLLEHKSSPERWTGLQLQNYLHQIWALHLKQARDDKKKTRFLPSIVPLVLYHGADPWTPPRQFKELLQPQDPALAPYQLQFEYLLCNLSDLSARELRAGLASRLAMRALHNIFAENSRRGLRHTLELLAEISDKQSVMDLVEMILRYFVQVHPTLEEPMIQEALHHTGDQTLMETFIDRYIREGREQGREQYREQYREQGREQGMEQGMEQGRKQGRQQGEQFLLRRLLTRRFGLLPFWVEQHLQTADCAQLEDWGEQLLDADSLETFFGKKQH